MSLKDFQIVAKLGEGAFSTVYKVKRLIDNQQYAMKKVKMNNLSEKQKQNALNQVRILASISHPNIIAYKEAFIEKGSNFLNIIMEYADDGDLLQKIKDHQRYSTKFSEQQIWSIFIQLTRGLKVLHDMKILHRDLKSANVFLTRDGVIKLGDLNVSKMVLKMCQTQTGTPYYASPEIWKDQPYDKKSDIWSLGCVLYEAISLKPPFRANDMQGLFKKVVRGFYPRLPPQYSNDLNVCLKMLLQVAPHLRPSVDKVLQFPLIAKHQLDLPEELIQKIEKGGDLMRTIKIDRRDNTDELSKKVDLPRARYESYSIDQKSMQKNLISLPKINKTFNTIESSQVHRNIEKEWNKKSEIVKKIVDSPQIYRKQKEREKQEYNNKKIIMKSRQNTYEAKSQKKLPLRYQGRLRQLSPEILHKMLQNEKKKRKLNSIIGNN